MLKKMKSDPRLQDLGDSLSKTRRTAKGELLLKLKANPKESSSKLRERTLEVLKDIAVVRVLGHAVTLEIKNLDEATSAEEFRKAINEKLSDEDDIESCAIQSMLRPVTVSKKLLIANKISWTLRNSKSTRDLHWILFSMRRKRAQKFLIL